MRNMTMEEVSSHQVQSDEQKKQADTLIREYLGRLNERVNREIRIGCQRAIGMLE